MPVSFTIQCDMETAGTPRVAVTPPPDAAEFELVDQELDTYPDPVLDDFGRPIP